MRLWLAATGQAQCRCATRIRPPLPATIGTRRRRNCTALPINQRKPPIRLIGTRPRSCLRVTFRLRRRRRLHPSASVRHARCDARVAQRAITFTHLSHLFATPRHGSILPACAHKVWPGVHYPLGSRSAPRHAPAQMSLGLLAKVDSPSQCAHNCLIIITRRRSAKLVMIQLDMIQLGDAWRGHTHTHTHTQLQARERTCVRLSNGTSSCESRFAWGQPDCKSVSKQASEPASKQAILLLPAQSVSCCKLNVAQKRLTITCVRLNFR